MCFITSGCGDGVRGVVLIIASVFGESVGCDWEEFVLGQTVVQPFGRDGYGLVPSGYDG